MKRLWVLIVVAGLLFGTVGLGLAKEKGKTAHRRRARARTRVSSVQDVNRPGISKAKKPQSRRLRGQLMIIRVMQQHIQQLQRVRKIASDEGATKTVEALKKIIAKEKGQLEKLKKRIRQQRMGQVGVTKGGKAWQAGSPGERGEHRRRSMKRAEHHKGAKGKDKDKDKDKDED